MMRSLYSGVSGLKNHQTRMDVIGNNISNVNTTGFKSSRATFADMISQNLSGASSPQGTIGGVNPKQIGLGSSVAAIDLLFTNGSVQSTGVNTDLCLSSTNALFILNTGSGTAYTRNGDFQFDADGNYVQAGNGYYVMGWMRDETTGMINTGGDVTKITIPAGKSMDPKATENIVFSNNLDSSTPIYDPDATPPMDPDASKCVQVFTVYSKLGNPIDLSMVFEKTGVGANQSVWEVTLIGATMTRSDGTKDTIDCAGASQVIVFDGNGVVQSPKEPVEDVIQLTYANTTGAKETQSISIDFSAITQFDAMGAGSTLAGKAADGYAAGTLKSVSIDSSGTITGTYTNGMKQAEAQIALQRFNNPGGLEKIGESLYQNSNNAGISGMPSTAAALGATLTPSALEMSNVDIADQFTDMIITQRGFQANSKIITVSDEMLETLINTKR